MTHELADHLQLLKVNLQLDITSTGFKNQMHCEDVFYWCEWALEKKFIQLTVTTAGQHGNVGGKQEKNTASVSENQDDMHH